MVALPAIGCGRLALKQVPEKCGADAASYAYCHDYQDIPRPLPLGSLLHLFLSGAFLEFFTILLDPIFVAHSISKRKWPRLWGQSGECPVAGTASLIAQPNEKGPTGNIDGALALIGWGVLWGRERPIRANTKIVAFVSFGGN